MNEIESLTNKLNLNETDQRRLGVELVQILYSNTELNYDVCAFNLTRVFQHLGSRVPELGELSNRLIAMFNESVNDKNSNPDLNQLEGHLVSLRETSELLSSGEKNFYECNQFIDESLSESIRLLTNETRPEVFKSILTKNNLCILSLVEIWLICSNKQIKNQLVELLYLCFKSEPSLIHLLNENTNLSSELCCSIQGFASQSDHNSVNTCLKCLILILENTTSLPLQFQNFLKTSNFLKYILGLIESDSEFLFMNTEPKKASTSLCIAERFIHFLLSLNKKFELPDENMILLNLFEKNEQQVLTDYKYLSESLVNMLNSEIDPLAERYKVKDSSQLVSYHSNSILKFFSDLFSIKTSKNIFYSNDFNVIIDIIIRKLTNLTAEDQIRVDYLSLIQLIVKNTDYKDESYRRFDLLECFNLILNEKDQHTIDQDIVRVILAENPQLLD